ncbi:MAG: hypothetical protein JKX97_07250 [Candidatus Lindowbacteria bacterium]|nr:hypothetical protein [Candidatus Lindowbacteria bacterium]
MFQMRAQFTKNEGSGAILAASITGCVLALTTFSISGCGTSDPQPSSDEYNQNPPTVAEGVSFSERSPSGHLNWSLKADFMIDESDVMTAENIIMRVHERDTSELVASGIVGEYVGGNCTAIAQSGVIRRESGGVEVVLSGGFIVHSSNGWIAEGERTIWDGEFLNSSDPVKVTRGRSTISGDTARIDPRRNVITMGSVSGTVMDLSL